MTGLKSDTGLAPADDEPEEQGPVRRCLVTGNRLAKEAMIRFVVGPEGDAVPDLACCLPGRGFWITARRDMVELASKKRMFDRAARRSLKPVAGLADRIEAVLAQRCRDTIGLSRRAGGAVAGFEKVCDALRKGQTGLLLEAADGAADGRRKVTWLAQDGPLVESLTAAELGAAFGRDHVVHAFVPAGPLATKLAIDGARLAGFRMPVEELRRRAGHRDQATPPGAEQQDRKTSP